MKFDVKTVLKNDYAIIILAYSIANFLMLLNIGLFWDDWTLFGEDSLSLVSSFSQTGYTFVGYTHSWLLSFPDPYILYRGMTFLLFLSSLLILKLILEHFKEISKVEVFLIILLTSVIPVNLSRVTFICFLYSVTYFFYFLAFYLFLKYIDTGKFYLRAISLILFLTSFITNSFLVFYIIVPLYLIYINKNINVKKLLPIFLKYLDFLFLPIVFWILKKLFLSPSGSYEGYNSFTNKFFLILSVVKSFTASIGNVLNYSLFFLSNHAFVIVILSTILYLILKNKVEIKRNGMKSDVLVFLISIALLIIAIVPYVLVGKVPEFYGVWNDRHLLITPLLFSIVTIFGIKIIIKELSLNTKIFSLFVSIIIVTFMSMSITRYYEFHKDWIKQVALIQLFKENKIIKENTTFIVRDNTIDLNAGSREYRYYELNGFSRKAFGTTTRLFVPEASADHYFKDSSTLQAIVKSDESHLSDYIPTSPQYLIKIEEGKGDITFLNVFGFMVRRKPFNPKFKELFKVEIEEIEGDI